jgi:hypothetical protein
MYRTNILPVIELRNQCISPASLNVHLAIATLGERRHFYPHFPVSGTLTYGNSYLEWGHMHEYP